MYMYISSKPEQHIYMSGDPLRKIASLAFAARFTAAPTFDADAHRAWQLDAALARAT